MLHGLGIGTLFLFLSFAGWNRLTSPGFLVAFNNTTLKLGLSDFVRDDVFISTPDCVVEITSSHLNKPDCRTITRNEIVFVKSAIAPDLRGVSISDDDESSSQSESDKSESFTSSTSNFSCSSFFFLLSSFSCAFTSSFVDILMWTPILANV